MEPTGSVYVVGPTTRAPSLLMELILLKVLLRISPW